MWLFHRTRTKDVPRTRQETRKYRAITVAGRRHLSDVAYMLPKDLSELNRLDFQHYIYRQILRGNFRAPLSKPRTILDVGCGTGIWCKEMAQQFPLAQVCGVDLESVKEHPTYQFLQADVLDGLPIHKNTFDFVHQRLFLASAIPASRWVEELKELLRVTRPGGWVEVAEVGIEGTNLGPLTRQFFDWGVNASLLRGLDARQVPYLDHYLRSAGGRNVNVWSVNVPMHTHASRIGIMMQMNLTSAFAALKGLYLSRGESESAFEQLLQQLPQEWEWYHSSLRFFVFTCQK